MTSPPEPGADALRPRRVDHDALARDDAAARPRGAQVEATGIALVRRGERVVPGPGSAARVVDGDHEGGALVTVEIPITITLGPSVEEITEVAAEIAMRRLLEALAARTVG